MSIASDVRVLNLEARVKALETTVAELRTLLDKPAEVPRGTDTQNSTANSKRSKYA